MANMSILSAGMMNKTTLIAGSKKVFLGACMSGGKKNISRLDTQLFRSSTRTKEKEAPSQLILIVNLQ